MTQRFIIDGRLPGQNEIYKALNSHRHSGSRQKKQWTQSIAWMAIGAHLKPVTGKCRVRFLWFEPNKRRDYDNIRAGAKFVLDGRVEAKVLEDDGWRVITGLEDQFYTDKDRPRIEVEIIEEANADRPERGN